MGAQMSSGWPAGGGHLPGLMGPGWEAVVRAMDVMGEPAVFFKGFWGLTLRPET